jgi:hypothetical protein
VVDISVTDRYFRAVAKIGFHYFLTQFQEHTGNEQMFSEIRQFILEGGGVDRANKFVRKREHALLGAMLTPGVRPNGSIARTAGADRIGTGDAEQLQRVIAAGADGERSQTI